MWGLLAGLTLMIGASAAAPANPPKVGDKVEIKFGDSWLDATVTWVEGEKVRARLASGMESWFAAGDYRVSARSATKPAAAAGDAPASKPPAGPRAGDTVEVSFAGTWLDAKVLKVDGQRAQAKLASGMEKWFGAGEFRLIPKVDPKFYAGLSPGSRVQAFDGSRWYPATVKRCEANRFFIHYDDFNDAWDGWLTTDKVRPRAEDAAAFTTQVAVGGGPAPPPGVIQTAAGSVMIGDIAGVRDLPSDQNVDWAVKPDPAPAPAAGIGNGPYALGAKFAEGETIHRLQFAGADALTALVCEDPSGPSKSRVARVSLASSHTPEVTTLPPGKRVVDFSADGTMLLCRATIADVPNCLEVSALSPAAKATPRELVWKPHTSKDNDGDLSMAAFIDAAHVISCDSQGDVILWELPAATTATTQATARPRAVYRMKINSGVRPTLSPGRKFFVATAKERLRFFDALSGAPLGDVPDVPLATNASIAFNTAGGLLSVTASQRMCIVDLSSGRIAREIPLPPQFLQKLSTATTWLPSGHLLLSNRYLVSPSQRLVIWAYLFPRGTKVESYGGNTWFIAGNTGPLSLCSVKLPHDQAKAAMPAVKIDDLLVFRKGDQVGIDLSTDAPGDVRDKIQASLEKQVKAMGLTVGGGPARIIASTTSGETKTMEYRIFGRGVQSVSVTEKIHTLRVELDGKEVWKVTNKAGASFMVSAKQGQPLEEAIREQQNQSYAWLAGITIPRDLVRPEGYDVAGISRVTASGLESVKAGEEPKADDDGTATPTRRRPRP